MAADELTWPHRPTCHDQNPHAAQFTPPFWRPPRPWRGPSEPYADTFRTCSYCGCIHPADLLDAAATHALSFEVADWKYGWPHKIYVDGIPSPIAGEPVHQYTYGPRDRIAGQAAPGFEPERYGSEGWRVVSSITSAPATMHAKWYNVHLADLAGDAFAAVADLIAERGGVRFDLIDADRLHYQVVPVEGQG